MRDFLNFNFNHKNVIKKRRPNGQTGAYGSKMTRPDFYSMVDFIQNGRLRPAVSFLSQPAILSGRTKATTNSAQTGAGILRRQFMILDLRRYFLAAVYAIGFAPVSLVTIYITRPAPVFSGDYLSQQTGAGVLGGNL